MDMTTVMRAPLVGDTDSWYHTQANGGAQYNIGDLRTFWASNSYEMHAQYYNGNEWIDVEYTVWTRDQTNNVHNANNSVL